MINEKKIGPLICNSYFAKTNPSSFYFVQPAILNGLDELWDRSAGNLAATGSLADASATVMASSARGTSGAGKRVRETAGHADDDDEEAEEAEEVDPATQRTGKKANHNKQGWGLLVKERQRQHKAEAEKKAHVLSEMLVATKEANKLFGMYSEKAVERGQASTAAMATVTGLLAQLVERRGQASTDRTPPPVAPVRSGPNGDHNTVDLVTDVNDVDFRASQLREQMIRIGDRVLQATNDNDTNLVHSLMDQQAVLNTEITRLSRAGTDTRRRIISSLKPVERSVEVRSPHVCALCSGCRTHCVLVAVFLH